MSKIHTLIQSELFKYTQIHNFYGKCPLKRTTSKIDQLHKKREFQSLLERRLANITTNFRKTFSLVYAASVANAFSYLRINSMVHVY